VLVTIIVPDRDPDPDIIGIQKMPVPVDWSRLVEEVVGTKPGPTETNQDYSLETFKRLQTSKEFLSTGVIAFFQKRAAQNWSGEIYADTNNPKFNNPNFILTYQQCGNVVNLFF
jgi:hypothetical protein